MAYGAFLFGGSVHIPRRRDFLLKYAPTPIACPEHKTSNSWLTETKKAAKRLLFLTIMLHSRSHYFFTTILNFLFEIVLLP